jgi:hypothetical protein
MRIRLLAVLAAAVQVSACSDHVINVFQPVTTPTASPTTPTDTLKVTVETNISAVTLKVGDTLRVSCVVKTNIAPGPSFNPACRWESQDFTRVQTTADGTIRAIFPTTALTPVKVMARWVADPTKFGTVLVTVIPK